MKFLNKELSPLGMGCWPIGGSMFAADRTPLGYSNSEDKESVNAIHAALANGITLFDTAAAYGAGHSERLLGSALKHRSDITVITKIGLGIDESTRTLTGEELAPESVLPAIEHCLHRLDRDDIDLLLLHPNSVPIDQATLVFDQIELARERGIIQSYGWSTDFVGNAAAMIERPGFVAIEHAMHVLMDAPTMQKLVHSAEKYALIRSPLAMGLLSGKYTVETKLPPNDIRSTRQDWTNYYINGKPNPQFMALFNAVRELLQSDGRSTVQGALGWLWARHCNNVPLPGARTVSQVEELAAALSFGALPENVVAEIDALVGTNNISEGNSPR